MHRLGETDGPKNNKQLALSSSKISSGSVTSSPGGSGIGVRSVEVPDGVQRSDSQWQVLRANQKAIVLSDGKQLVVYDKDKRQLVQLEHHKPVGLHDSKYFLYLSSLQNKQLTDGVDVVDMDSDTSIPSAGRDPGVDTEALNSGYYKKFFTAEKKLGAGSCGAVWLVRHHINNVNLGLYALKKVPIGDSLEWLKLVLTEVKVLERLHFHPNIIGYKHSWLEIDQIADFGPQVPCLFILMEYADSGNLEDYIFNVRKGSYLEENEIWIFFLDLLFGIDYLHAMGIIHRDIKSPNLLLNCERDPLTKVPKRNRLMISDFGTCVMKKFIGGDNRTGNTGTPEWIAPELLTKTTSGRWADYDTYCDMWGLGLCLHFMAFGQLPWKQSRRNLDALSAEILECRIEFPKGAPPRSSEMLNLIRALLQTDPGKRPTARDLILSVPIENLVKRLNDPQISRLLADVLIQGPHTNHFKERVPTTVIMNQVEYSTLLQLPPPLHRSVSSFVEELALQSNKTTDPKTESESNQNPTKHSPTPSETNLTTPPPNPTNLQLMTVTNHKHTDLDPLITNPFLRSIGKFLLFVLKLCSNSVLWGSSFPNSILSLVSPCLAGFFLISTEGSFFFLITSFLEFLWNLYFLLNFSTLPLSTPTTPHCEWSTSSSSSSLHPNPLTEGTLTLLLTENILSSAGGILNNYWARLCIILFMFGISIFLHFYSPRRISHKPSKRRRL